MRKNKMHGLDHPRDHMLVTSRPRVRRWSYIRSVVIVQDVTTTRKSLGVGELVEIFVESEVCHGCFEDEEVGRRMSANRFF